MALRLQRVFDCEKSSENAFDTTHLQSSVSLFLEFFEFSKRNVRDNSNNNADNSHSSESFTHNPSTSSKSQS